MRRVEKRHYDKQFKREAVRLANDPKRKVHVVTMALHAKGHDARWKHHLAAALIVLSCYVGVVIGMANNYIVTV